MKYHSIVFRFCSIQIFFSVLFSISLLSQEQGKIRRFDDKAKAEKKDTSHSASASSSAASTTSSSSSSEVSIVDAFKMIEAVVYVVEAVGYVTVGTLIQFPGEDSSVHENSFWTRGLTNYPYFDPERGMYSIPSNKTFAFSFSGHRFSDGNNLTGYSGRLFVSPLQSFNLEAHIVDLSEKLTKKTDHLRFYNFFIDYNRIKAERFSLWWGLGIKGMNGPTVNETGLAFNSGFEVFPFVPLSIMMNYNVGFINSNSLQEFIFTGNWYVNRYSFSLGYQLFSVGNAELDGMIFGVAAHF